MLGNNSSEVNSTKVGCDTFGEREREREREREGGRCLRAVRKVIGAWFNYTDCEAYRKRGRRYLVHI